MTPRTQPSIAARHARLCLLRRLALSLFTATIALSIVAEWASAEDQDVIKLGTEDVLGIQGELPGARARLADPAIDSGARGTWELSRLSMLRRSPGRRWSSTSPAAGENPKIGDPARGSYFDFKDGQPRPYYIVGSAK